MPLDKLLHDSPPALDTPRSTSDSILHSETWLWPKATLSSTTGEWLAPLQAIP